MKRLNTVIVTVALLLAAGPAHAVDSVDIPWTHYGLAGTSVNAVVFMPECLYVGAADGLHILDLETGTWLPLAREDVGSWPVTAIGRSPYRPDRVITGRVDGAGLGAIALTSLADGVTEVRLGGLPGPLSTVALTDLFGQVRLWACVPGSGADGLALQSGDSGDSWVPLTGHGLTHPHAIALELLDGVGWPSGERCYLAGDTGVAWTIDHGETWVQDASGLPTATVNDMLVEETLTGIPDKVEGTTFGFAATDAGLYFRTTVSNPWRSILPDPCLKVCFAGAGNAAGRVYVLTGDRRLLSGAVDATGVDTWVDWSGNLDSLGNSGNVVITDLATWYTYLAVATEADGVFMKTWPISSPAELPSATQLDLRTAPNPFNPATTISFHAPVAGPARLAIYDLQGRLVDVLLDGDVTVGPVERQWRPSGRASGVFMARLECGGAVATRRLALIR